VLSAAPDRAANHRATCRTTVSLPVTLAKYDVHFEALAGTTTLRAFGLYQYET
jgi:hypothetical protein